MKWLKNIFYKRPIDEAESNSKIPSELLREQIEEINKHLPNLDKNGINENKELYDIFVIFRNQYELCLNLRRLNKD